MLVELKMAVRSDMSAANITAIMIPLEQVKGSVSRLLVEITMAVRSDMSEANMTAIMMPPEQVNGSVSRDCEERAS